MFGRARKGGSAAGWTAVEASADGIVGVSVRAPGSAGAKPQVVKCAQLPETELDSATLSQLAKKISTGGFPWTFPLPRGDYKIFVVQKPTVEASEMAQSVRWSLGPMLDFAVDEAAVDWMSIPTPSASAMGAPNANQRPPHIYVIAAHRDVVAKRTDAFKRTKVPLEAVDIRETAQRNVAIRMQTPDEGLGMVVMNARGVQITFTYGGELYLDRYIEEPIESLMSGDEEMRDRVFDRITLQVQRSVDFINRNYPFIPVGRIVVAPMPAPIPLRDYLAANVTERVEALDLANVFDFSQTPELTEEETQSRYFTALGAALRGMEVRA